MGQQNRENDYDGWRKVKMYGTSLHAARTPQAEDDNSTALSIVHTVPLFKQKGSG